MIIKLSEMNKGILSFLIVWIVLLLAIKRSQSKGIWKSKCPELDIPNANIRIRARGRLAKIRCKSSFVMIEGDRRLSCIRKEWHGRIPYCIKSGCANIPLENGIVIKLYSGALMHFVCNPGYSLEGSPAVFCNGSNWNATAPECQVPPSKAGHLSCTFETKDLCGWTQDSLDDFDWKWSSALINSFQGSFGAKFDHTFGSITGHYIYADSNEGWSPSHFARLFSPILEVPLETPSCVTFFYHLYGPTTGVFNVYLRPEAVPFESISPTLSMVGFHPDKWLLAFLHIDDSFEDWFQVILEAQGGAGHVSDFAVDDFRVSSGNVCINLELQYDAQQSTTTKRSFVSVAMETTSIEPIRISPTSDFPTDVYSEGANESSLDSMTYVNEPISSTKSSTTKVKDSTFPSLDEESSTLSTIARETSNTWKKIIIPLTVVPTPYPITLFTLPKKSTKTTLERKTLTHELEIITVPITKETSIKPKPTRLRTTTKATTITTATATTTTTTTTTTSTTTSPPKTTKTITTATAAIPFSKLVTKNTRTTRNFNKITKYTPFIENSTAQESLKKAESKTLIKAETSTGIITALISGVSVCFLLIGVAIVLVWRKSRSTRMLEEDSDVRHLKEESKEDEQTNENEKPSRRPFATSYRLLENSSYPQEYDGTAV